MGTVYRAWDTRLNVPTALKEMIPQPRLDATTVAQLRQQFHQEAIILAEMNHPHLMAIQITPTPAVTCTASVRRCTIR